MSLKRSEIALDHWDHVWFYTDNISVTQLTLTRHYAPVSLPAIVTGDRSAWTEMSDLCLLPGGAAREIHKPSARNAVSSELHLKVATAGEEHWQAATPALGCVSLDQRYISTITLEEWHLQSLPPCWADNQEVSLYPSFPPHLPNGLKSVFLTKVSSTQLHTCSKKQRSDHP